MSSSSSSSLVSVSMLSVCTVNSTYVAISAIRPFCPPFLPFDHSHHLTFYFPQRLSAFRHSFPIFLSGFPIFLDGFPFSKKSEKIYLWPVLGKQYVCIHSCHLTILPFFLPFRHSVCHSAIPPFAIPPFPPLFLLRLAEELVTPQPACLQHNDK